MNALNRWWTDLQFRFVSMTGLPATRRAALPLLGLIIGLIGLLALAGFLLAQPAFEGVMTSGGFGPGWQCENIPRTIVCRRVDKPAAR